MKYDRKRWNRVNEELSFSCTTELMYAFVLLPKLLLIQGAHSSCHDPPNTNNKWQENNKLHIYYLNLCF